MVVMVSLSASVVSAMAFAMIQKLSRGKEFIFLILFLLFVETLPASLPVTSTAIPDYVTALADLPNDGGVIDKAASTKYLQLYYQTQHRKPMVFGYVARTPSSIVEKEKGLVRAINRGEYVKLWDEYQVRYIVTTDVIEYENPVVSLELVYQDGDVNIYRLDCKCDNGE
jgi:hypothetical protein